MTLKFTAVDNREDTNTQHRFAISSVSNNHEFKWHLLAPGPAYSICLVEILDIKPNKRINIRCLNKNKQPGPSFDINLADWSQAWSESPSTIGTLPGSVSDLNGETCALLCLSDNVIQQSGSTNFMFSDTKYPYGEDAPSENAKLRAALMKLRPKVTSDEFKMILDSVQLSPSRVSDLGDP